MTIKIIKEKISKDELEKITSECFGDMVKAVVDIKKGILALGGELHADGEELLLKEGSKQMDLWGINIYPAKVKNKWLEFSALINIRPSIDNNSMEIQDPKIKETIKNIVDNLIN